MRNLILIISIAILIGGTYSIGFYNGNNNASKTITLAKNGGEQYLKLNPPGKTISELKNNENTYTCLLYTSPSPRDGLLSRMPSSA